MAIAGLTTLTAVVTVLSVALATIPKWLAGGLHRHRIWRLRDAFVDETLKGELPSDHPAVRELRFVLDRSARSSAPKATSFLAFAYGLRKTNENTKAFLASRAEWSPIGDLSEAQMARVVHYRETWMILFVGWVLLGSWSGVFTVLASAPRAIQRAATAKPLVDDEVAADGGPLEQARRQVRIATDVTVTNSRRGRRYTEVVRRSPFDELVGAAP